MYCKHLTLYNFKKKEFSWCKYYKKKCTQRGCSYIIQKAKQQQQLVHTRKSEV
jgi:hypothetical protein